MIPKKIHQFWTGKPMPDVFVRWCAGWRTLHPEWEYRLWDIESVYDLDEEVGEALITCNQTDSIKSDVARSAIVYHLGGVYLDTDFEPRKPLDPLLAQGMAAFIVPQGDEPAAAVFGSVPHGLWISLCREAALSYAFSPPHWAPTVMCDLARRYGVPFLDTDLFYPYKYWEHSAPKDDPFPDAYGVHRHAGSWCGGQPDVPKE